jgi:hypothetical protein
VVGRLSFVAAHVLGVGTLVLAVVDVVSRPSGTVADTVGVIGLVLALRGFAGVLAAQTEMPTTSLRCAQAWARADVRLRFRLLRRDLRLRMLTAAPV